MMTRVLGIDPGSRLTGYGLVDVEQGRLTYVASGCIRTVVGSMGERLNELHQGLLEIIANYHPDEAAIEQVFIARNPASALKLGQARGVALAACMSERMGMYDYATRQVKLAVVGTGKAGKPQVQHMVQALLKLPGSPQADAADALAIAICHINTRGL